MRRSPWPVAAAVVCALVPLLPWARSGRAVRSGYEIVRVARSSGAVPGWHGLVAVVGMAMLPLLAAGAVAVVALRRDRWTAILAGMAGLVCVGAAVAVHLAPLGALYGVWVGLACGSAAVGCAVAAR